MTEVSQALRPGTEPGLRAVLGGLLDASLASAEADALREVAVFHLLFHLAGSEEGAAVIRFSGGSAERLRASIQGAMDLDRLTAPTPLLPAFRRRGETDARAREDSASDLQARVLAAARVAVETLGAEARPHRVLLLALAGLASSCSVSELALRQAGLEGLIDEEQIRERILAELHGLRGPEPLDFDAELPDDIQDLLRDAERVRDEDMPPPEPEPPTPAQASAQATQAAPKKGDDDAEAAVRATLRNLSLLAQAGRLEPAYGREEMVARVISALSRRRKGSVLLHGEPGVGKTAIAESVALGLRQPGVDARLAARPVYELSLPSLVAGTRYRGDFERRMDALLKIAREDNAILFMDEIHLLVGSGASALGGMDAANILKPTLARGEIAVIGATTNSELRVLRSDGALMRRFELVAVGEPGPDLASEILRRAAKGYLDHHRVRLGPGALEEILDLSEKHFPERLLPDKAFDLLDAACVAAREEGGARVVERAHLEIAARRMGARLPGLPPEPLRRRLAGLAQGLRASLPEAAEAAPRLARAFAGAAMGLSRGRNAGTFAIREAGPGGARRLAAALGRELDLPVVTVDASLWGRSDLLERLIGTSYQRSALDPQGELVEAADRHGEMILLLEGMDRTHEAVEALVVEIAARGVLQAANGRRLRMAGCWLLLGLSREGTARAPMGFGGGTAAEDLLEGLAPALREQVLEAMALAPLAPREARTDARAVEEEFRRLGLDLRLSPAARRAVDGLLARELDRAPEGAVRRVAIRLSGLVLGMEGGVAEGFQARHEPDESLLLDLAP